MSFIRDNVREKEKFDFLLEQFGFFGRLDKTEAIARVIPNEANSPYAGISMELEAALQALSEKIGIVTSKIKTNNSVNIDSSEFSFNFADGTKVDFGMFLDFIDVARKFEKNHQYFNRLKVDTDEMISKERIKRLDYSDFEHRLSSLSKDMSRLEARLTEIGENTAGIVAKNDELSKTYEKKVREIDESSTKYRKMAEESRRDYLQKSEKFNSEFEKIVEFTTKKQVEQDQNLAKFKEHFLKTEEESNNFLQTCSETLEYLNNQKDAAESILEQIKDSQESHTNLRLSGIFEKNAGRVEEVLRSVEVKLWLTAVVLFISAVPLFLFVSAPLISYFFESFNAEDILLFQASFDTIWGVLASVLMRVSIMIPAAWLFLTWNRRYNLLLQLREHYKYKHAIAVSIEGLKVQSEKYAEEIITHLVAELASDPAKIMSRSTNGNSQSGTLIERLISKLHANPSTDNK